MLCDRNLCSSLNNFFYRSTRIESGGTRREEMHIVMYIWKSCMMMCIRHGDDDYDGINDKLRGGDGGGVGVYRR